MLLACTECCGGGWQVSDISGIQVSLTPQTPLSASARLSSDTLPDLPPCLSDLLSPSLPFSLPLSFLPPSLCITSLAPPPLSSRADSPLSSGKGPARQVWLWSRARATACSHKLPMPCTVQTQGMLLPGFQVMCDLGCAATRVCDL
eukprot:1632855-Rhodomonas_salina.1